jgi:hypothetical protein
LKLKLNLSPLVIGLVHLKLSCRRKGEGKVATRGHRLRVNADAENVIHRNRQVHSEVLAQAVHKEDRTEGVEHDGPANLEVESVLQRSSRERQVTRSHKGRTRAVQRGAFNTDSIGSVNRCPIQLPVDSKATPF